MVATGASANLIHLVTYVYSYTPTNATDINIPCFTVSSTVFTVLFAHVSARSSTAFEGFPYSGEPQIPQWLPMSHLLTFRAMLELVQQHATGRCSGNCSEWSRRW